MNVPSTTKQLLPVALKTAFGVLAKIFDPSLRIIYPLLRGTHRDSGREKTTNYCCALFGLEGFAYTYSSRACEVYDGESRFHKVTPEGSLYPND